MRHLLSPPTCLSVAAERERLQSKAEAYTAQAERCEMKAVARRLAHDKDIAFQGQIYAKLAKQCREHARLCIAAATDLTDYTHDLDRERESWILLHTLREDAALRSPHPVILRPRKR